MQTLHVPPSLTTSGASLPRLRAREAALVTATEALAAAERQWQAAPDSISKK